MFLYRVKCTRPEMLLAQPPVRAHTPAIGDLATVPRGGLRRPL